MSNCITDDKPSSVQIRADLVMLCMRPSCLINYIHDDVIKWKHFPRYWPFVRGIHRSPVNSHHKGQWRGALMFSLTCTRINGWVNNGEPGDLRRHLAHYDVTVMQINFIWSHMNNKQHEAYTNMLYIDIINMYNAWSYLQSGLLNTWLG